MSLTAAHARCIPGQGVPSDACTMPQRACIVMRVRALRSRQRWMTSARARFLSAGMAMRWLGSVMACIFWMKASAEKGVWP